MCACHYSAEICWPRNDSVHSPERPVQFLFRAAIAGNINGKEEFFKINWTILICVESSRKWWWEDRLMDGGKHFPTWKHDHRIQQRFLEENILSRSSWSSECWVYHQDSLTWSLCTILGSNDWNIQEKCFQLSMRDAFLGCQLNVVVFSNVSVNFLELFSHRNECEAGETPCLPWRSSLYCPLHPF